MTEREAFFTLDGDDVVAGPLCRGPWDPGAAHFGPPAALMGRAAEREGEGDKRVARLSFEVLSPVPLGRLRVATTVVRPGRRVDLVEVVLTDLAADRPVALCRAWRQRRPEAPLDVPAAGLASDPLPPGPDGVQRMGLFMPPDAVTTIAPNGGGTATARLFDTAGAIGRSTQSLFVDAPAG